MAGTVSAVPVAVPGWDLILSIGGTAVAGDTECKYTASNKVGKIPPTCASFPRPGYAPGEVEEKITCQALVSLTDTSLLSVQAAALAGSVLTVSFAVSTGTISGSAYCESFEISGKSEDPAAMAAISLILFATTNSL